MVRELVFAIHSSPPSGVERHCRISRITVGNNASQVLPHFHNTPMEPGVRDLYKIVCLITGNTKPVCEVTDKPGNRLKLVERDLQDGSHLSDRTDWDVISTVKLIVE